MFRSVIWEKSVFAVYKRSSYGSLYICLVSSVQQQHQSRYRTHYLREVNRSSREESLETLGRLGGLELFATHSPHVGQSRGCHDEGWQVAHHAPVLGDHENDVAGLPASGRRADDSETEDLRRGVVALLAGNTDDGAKDLERGEDLRG